MARFTETLSCDEVLDGLEAFLDHRDGSDGAEEGLPPGPPRRLAGIEAHLARCPSCASELALAASIRDELRALPSPELPDRPSSFLPAVRRNRTPLYRWLPLAAALGVILLSAVLLLFRAASGPETPYSAAEVARAERQARYAFARVAEVSERAGLELRDDVLVRRVVAPVAASLGRPLNLPATTPTRRTAQPEP